MELPYPQTIVCQIGACRHFAVPVALHESVSLTEHAVESLENRAQH